jgi:hypothetical protein
MSHGHYFARERERRHGGRVLKMRFLFATIVSCSRTHPGQRARIGHGDTVDERLSRAIASIVSMHLRMTFWLAGLLLGIVGEKTWRTSLRTPPTSRPSFIPCREYRTFIRPKQSSVVQMSR